MRYAILVEDTPRGVRYYTSLVHNGVNDGVERSLAVHLGAQFELFVKGLQKIHALVVEENPDVAPRALPAPPRR